MRVLRKVVGCERFDAGSEYTDLDVRRILNMPSIECILRRRRLLYLCRLLRHGPNSLHALSSASTCERETNSLPWTDTIVRDLVRVFNHFHVKLAGLGCPIACAGDWYRFIKA